MTTFAEQIEDEQAEHDAAENTDDAEPDDTPEPDAEPADDQPTDDQPTEPEGLVLTEELIRKLDRAANNHRKKIIELLGPEAGEHECPLCQTLGYLPEAPVEGTEYVVVVEDGQSMLIGRMVEPLGEYEPAQDKETCDECKGKGLVSSGSLVPEFRIVACGKCQGAGWRMKPRDQATTTAAPVAGLYVPDVTNVQPVAGPADAWGRPSGHAHYGVAPADIRV